MPFIGTDLGEAFEADIILEPGVVMVLEPVIWDDGHGGYRAEEVVAVTDSGYEMLGSFPYSPFYDAPIQW
jgi:Xaa-Pro aminopeptidase